MSRYTMQINIEDIQFVFYHKAFLFDTILNVEYNNVNFLLEFFVLTSVVYDPLHEKF